MRRLPALVLAAALAWPAGAWAAGPDDVIASLPKDAWENSVHKLEPQIHTLEKGITPMEKEEKDGAETVLTLASDILFAFDKADISERAEAKIEKLADKIPDDASVEVSGHTDSIGSASYNKSLSEKRAKAVAAILKKARPDLTLDVEGFGKDRPVAPNTNGDKDNPEGRALNRRVEIRYEG